MKRSEVDARRVRELLAQGVRPVHIAARLRISKSAVSRIACEAKEGKA